MRPLSTLVLVKDCFSVFDQFFGPRRARRLPEEVRVETILVPDHSDDLAVAASDYDCRNKEKGYCYKCDVQFPLIVSQIDPALNVALDDCFFED